MVDGFLLDRGFQIFLTSYPEAQVGRWWGQSQGSWFARLGADGLLGAEVGGRGQGQGSRYVACRHMGGVRGRAAGLLGAGVGQPFAAMH